MGPKAVWAVGGLNQKGPLEWPHLLNPPDFAGGRLKAELPNAEGGSGLPGAKALRGVQLGLPGAGPDSVQSGIKGPAGGRTDH